MPGQSQRFDPSRGPQRTACFLLALRAKRKEPDALGSLRFQDGKPGTPLRAQPFRPTTTNQRQIMMEIDQDTLTEKTSKGRHGSKKRPNRSEVYFTDEEHSIVKKMADAAGKSSLPVFIRELVLNEGTVTAALTAEEKKSITDLSNIGTNIWKTRNSLIVLMMNKDASKARSKKMNCELQKVIDSLNTMFEDFEKIHSHFAEKIKDKSQK